MDSAFRGTIKAQSAMEYLMTYGWAILIIAVVLGALFELGVFSGTFFMPHVLPGSCHVFRPYGPRTVGSINLEGECQGALPQYVAEMQNPTGSVRIEPTSYISMANPNGFSDQFTASVWVNVMATGSGSDNKQPIFSMDCGHIFEINYNSSGRGTFDVYSTSTGVSSGPLIASFGKWYNLVETYSSGIIKFYVNGAYVNQTTSSGSLNPIGGLNISNEGGCADSLTGLVSNAQLYNASLSANDVYALYSEGIGGAPIGLGNLDGWWPLNGNANDYSGNNNDGTASNVIYTTNWESGYTQP